MAKAKTNSKSPAKAPSKKPPAKGGGSGAKKKPAAAKVKPAPTPSAKKVPLKAITGKAKPTAPKPTGKSGPAKPPAATKGGKKPESKAAPKAAAAPPPEPSKPNRKGITIVTPKPPAKRAKAAPAPAPMPAAGSLLGPGTPKRKPLIPSGPSAPILGLALDEDAAAGRKRKSPFTKRQLEKYRLILLAKRAELVGDIGNMETQALRGQSGSLSHTPQHIAEQGSETYEQSLALDLAAADRQLLREIEAALQRINDGVYGVCEMTGKPINQERLDELPWARYSIEAAREIERRAGRL
ncbi:MAG TPA: TraR/DksA C4-type zinc finger protein [Phycisphaerales bacterium]|nr:TraR/DksA C4-type zinc finger protein [Phycisphaerales bacterium]